MQAEVRIPGSQTKGRSKIGVGENTNHRYQENIFNKRQTKTNTDEAIRYRGEESLKINDVSKV